MRLKLDAAVIKNKSGLGIRAGSTRPGKNQNLILIACIGFLSKAQGVGPDTDGSLPGSNNGEGIGVRALTNDINGGFNTATGVLSLFSNTSGFFNSATGAYSLANNISGSNNTANGYAALYRNTANGSTATGFAALYNNTTGTENTANGANTLFNNTPASSTRPLERPAF